ncbi:hypothetical protein DJ021_00635 [Phenylobacterium hankyongense]|uniref:RimK family alpha-L-glutamate ligase n=1 Tax=Phenylobacterium hankyongense TaxID=1813876 RepID=A0A328AXU2_9CAUL|nr:hypothetical protein [Phenylobacterium hankyongense]RAK58414.1 hypothetical protein DJ021_00635 [Phenylobacterium hankyongense]
MAGETESPSADGPLPQVIGLAALARAATDQASVQEVLEALIGRVAEDSADAGALLDLSTLLLATGNRDKGLELQGSAIGLQRCYRVGAPLPEPGLRLLVFMTAGDFTANTPLEFLLEGSDVELIACFVDGPPVAHGLPDHDLAFLAVGESETAGPLLASLDGAFAQWPRPVFNARADVIAGLTRDGVAAKFPNHPHVLCPATARTSRRRLADVAAGREPLAALAETLAFPIIARPVGSHAGVGLEKLGGPQALGDYLAAHPDAEFFVAGFVDYSAPDGRFRKLRVVFIDGRPFLSHLAVSERWMVHYLNADMAQSSANRDEEAEAMATFDDGFAARHAAAFRALTTAFPLDYFGIDCAETPDGRLLVFEVDVAMIVHATDPEDLYPYKKPAMSRLFAAFVSALKARAAPAR